MLFTQLAMVLNPQLSSAGGGGGDASGGGGARLSGELQQAQQLAKAVENVNRVCDLLAVNLRSAHEAQTLSNELKLFYRYYANMGAMDANRNEPGSLLNSVAIQTQRIADYAALMRRFTTTNSATTATTATTTTTPI